MRKSLFILIILFLSCDSVEETGLPEYEGGFNYYDYIAYGWSEFLNENYDNAIYSVIFADLIAFSFPLH